MLLFDLTAQSASTYCERTSPDLLAEPLNALTSVLVIMVAVFGFARLRRRNLLSPSVVVLMGLAVAIGVGSLLLHTFATLWAEIADVVPIWAFVAVYGFLALRSFVPGRFSLPFAAVLSVGVFASGVGLALGGAPVNLGSSAQYIPAAVMILAVLAFIWQARHPSLMRLGVGVGLFLLAIGFRSLDLVLCDLAPGGTHFLWHVTNCLVFWYLIEAYALHHPASRGRARTDSAVPNA